ncbi:MAG: hypothetical protein GF379_03095 [Candidatus Omnitrophica bacterium]|nr:hypothetical protein [Candidatus Omnitrophota bacterium]
MARELKGGNFSAVVNYLFLFSILYILNFMLFLVYIRIGFFLSIGEVIFEGVKDGASLLQQIFTQALR